ncbi:VOC family protein [Geodermatophilus sp. SYSU D00965]
MRTLHFGLRVADRERSLAFYTALAYEVVGEVPETGLGHPGGARKAVFHDGDGNEVGLGEVPPQG